MILPQVNRLLFQSSDPTLDEEQIIARDIVTRVIMSAFYQIVTDHTKIRVDAHMRSVHALLKVLVK